MVENKLGICRAKNGALSEIRSQHNQNRELLVFRLYGDCIQCPWNKLTMFREDIRRSSLFKIWNLLFKDQPWWNLEVHNSG